MNNHDYRINFFMHMMLQRHGALIRQKLSGQMRNAGGSNVRLLKTGARAE